MHLPTEDGQAESAWVAGYIARWFASTKTVTYAIIKRALDVKQLRLPRPFHHSMSIRRCENGTVSHVLQLLTPYGYIKTAEQRTIMQQYGDWYSGR